MCKITISHWAHPDENNEPRICLRATGMVPCAINTATPAAQPEACPDRVDEVNYKAEESECPMCTRTNAFKQYVTHVAAQEGVRTTGTQQAHMGPLLSQQSGDSSSANPQAGVGGQLPRRSVTRSSVSTQSSRGGFCEPGRHDMEDLGNGALQCRLCGISPDHLGSTTVQGSPGGGGPWSVYGTPQAFSDDEGDDDDGSSTVVGADDDVIGEVDEFEQQLWDALREQSVPPEDAGGAAQVPPPGSPAMSVLSTLSAAMWRERERAVRAVRERDEGRGGRFWQTVLN